MSNPIGIGFVGCGELGNMVLPHFQLKDTQDKTRVAAVCDNLGERVQAAKEKFGVPRAYTDYAEFLKDDDVDLVLLLLPMQLHASFALQALDAGKHVYIQKAMANTLEEANAIVEATRKSGLKVGAAPGQILSPAFQKAREIVQSGTLGHVYWAFTNNMGGGPGYAWYYRKGGGALNNVTVYSLASLTSVLGPVQRVTALSGIAVPEVRVAGETMTRESDDNTVLLMDFGGVTHAIATGTDCQSGKSLSWGHFSLFGKNASVEGVDIHMPSGWPIKLRLYEKGKDEQVLDVPITDQPYISAEHAALKEPHVYTDIMHMADCIIHDEEPILSVEHGRHVVEIIEKSYQAAQTGAAQTLTTTFNYK